MKRRINACVAVTLQLVLLFFAGCSNASPIDPHKKVSDQAKRLRSDIESLRSDYADAIASSERDKQSLIQREASLKEKMQQLDKLLANLVPVGPAPIPPSVPAPPPKPVLPPEPAPKPVDPEPAKPVNPEPENGRFAVAKQVYRIASVVDSPDRVTECQLLAAVFESVGARVAAGALNGSLLNPQWRQVSAALTAANKPIIAKHLSVWNSPATQLGEAIGQRYSDGKLDTNQDWSDLLQEISRGLKAVKS